MKKIFLQLLIPSFAVVVIFTCKKDKEHNAAKTEIELLTMGSWKYTVSTINPAYNYYGDGILDKYF